MHVLHICKHVDCCIATSIPGEECPTTVKLDDIRATHEGGKVLNPPETKNGLRAARFGIGAAPTLGSMLWARFSSNLHRKIDLTNAFKSFFRDDFFELCSKIAGILAKQGAKGRKVWNLPQPLPEPSLRVPAKALPRAKWPYRPNLTV